MVSMKRMQVALVAAIFAIVTSAVAGQKTKCTPEVYKKGVGYSRSGCPEPAMGNFYQQGRTILTDLLPVMVKFASFDYSSPTTESLAYRAYLVSKFKGVVKPFTDFQCRCDKSLVDEAKALRDAFIGGELEKIKTFVAQSGDLKATQGMQSFINKNKQYMMGMRCAPVAETFQVEPPSFLTELPANENCVPILAFSKDKKKIVRSQVVCDVGKCPNRANVF